MINLCIVLGIIITVAFIYAFLTTAGTVIKDKNKSMQLEQAAAALKRSKCPLFKK